VHSVSETSNKFEKSTDEVFRIIDEGKKKLFAAREIRPKPHLDDKILTTWNGLMISAFAKAFQAFGNASYIDKARRSADFIISNLYRPETKTLLHRYRDGEAKIDGTLEDYAFFTQGLIDLYESSFEDKYLDFSIKLTETVIKDFYDSVNGGFYDTTEKDKSILVRTKEDYDSAEPTGNSIAIMNLLRLSFITDNKDWFDKAYNSILAFSGKLEKMPYAMPQMLVALEYALFKPKQIVIAGKKKDELTQKMIREVHKRFLPNRILIQLEPDNTSESKTFASKIITKSDKTTAYVCENFACKLPTSDLNDFIKLIEN
jgi:uncharacterized protein YyaL (SSP411 family)